MVNWNVVHLIAFATFPFWGVVVLSLFVCFHGEWKTERQGFDRADKHTCVRCGAVRFYTKKRSGGAW